MGGRRRGGGGSEREKKVGGERKPSERGSDPVRKLVQLIPGGKGEKKVKEKGKSKKKVIVLGSER